MIIKAVCVDVKPVYDSSKGKIREDVHMVLPSETSPFGKGALTLIVTNKNDLGKFVKDETYEVLIRPEKKAADDIEIVDTEDSAKSESDGYAETNSDLVKELFDAE